MRARSRMPDRRPSDVRTSHDGARREKNDQHEPGRINGPRRCGGIAGQTAPTQHIDDLQDSLARLGKLATGLLSLEDSLTRVAEYAVRAIPGAEGAGLTLLEENRSDTIVSTADFVARSRRHSIQPRPGPMPQCRCGSTDRFIGYLGAVTAAGRSLVLAWGTRPAPASCPCH